MIGITNTLTPPPSGLVGVATSKSGKLPSFSNGDGLYLVTMQVTSPYGVLSGYIWYDGEINGCLEGITANTSTDPTKWYLSKKVYINGDVNASNLEITNLYKTTT